MRKERNLFEIDQQVAQFIHPLGDIAIQTMPSNIVGWQYPRSSSRPFVAPGLGCFVSRLVVVRNSAPSTLIPGVCRQDNQTNHHSGVHQLEGT